ncbi:hypothetical protein JCM5350_007187 [Sporobolomyces pararoseus]
MPVKSVFQAVARRMNEKKVKEHQGEPFVSFEELAQLVQLRRKTRETTIATHLLQLNKVLESANTNLKQQAEYEREEYSKFLDWERGLRKALEEETVHDQVLGNGANFRKLENLIKRQFNQRVAQYDLFPPKFCSVEVALKGMEDLKSIREVALASNLRLLAPRQHQGDRSGTLLSKGIKELKKSLIKELNKRYKSNLYLKTDLFDRVMAVIDFLSVKSENVTTNDEKMLPEYSISNFLASLHLNEVIPTMNEKTQDSIAE